ncbi:9-cis-epoxycarotenoid dioxygenase NCED1, chloroplastic [Elaeis guineensis]|uniref:9-cis-epoxycarotenoid dioxygenase NCED1, chloroplastic n=1 Tax=Elaeis guineensis var. tenera TaxID=51953 RepID=UPI003C6CC90B
MDALSSSAFLRISAVRTEEKPPRPTIHQPRKPKTTTTTTTTTQPKPEKSRSPRISPPPPPSIPAALCNAIDDLINNFIDPAAHRPSVDPRHVLSDNWAPVGELPPTPCPVVRGRIPSCLAGGAYIRNGPNPQHLPRGPHHLFDGDGMLHSLLLPSISATGDALLCSRYVRTYKYLLEREAGGPVLPSVFAGFHGAGGIARGAVTAARVLTGQMNPLEGVGLANTSLAFHAGQLYALGESDLPYALHVDPSSGEIATRGRCDFEGRLFMGMTAHPKKDPATGELFAFRYGPVPPFVTYFRFDPAGRKSADVPIFSVAKPSFLHDFAVTERHAVFPDIQIVMKPMDMVLGGGAPVGSDPEKVTRLGVLPRYASSEAEMRWFEVPGLNPIHAVNAWEEDGGRTLVLVAPNVLSVEHALDRMELVHSCVEMVRIDLESGAATRTPLSAGNLDFGVIHPGYVGRKNRYAYLGIGDPMPRISGVVKLDLQKAGRGDCTVARREFGPGCFGGEPFFVPEGDVEEEDAGYLVSYVHDEGSGESRFVVMDARSPELDVVAEVLLPSRVPYGFHGLFVTQTELRSQRPRWY